MEYDDCLRYKCILNSTSIKRNTINKIFPKVFNSYFNVIISFNFSNHIYHHDFLSIVELYSLQIMV